MIAALSFLLDYEKIEDDDDSDAPNSEDELTPQQSQAAFNKQAIYNVSCTFFLSSFFFFFFLKIYCNYTYFYV